MIHPDTEIRHISESMGFGVFATRAIPRGTVVWTLCELDQHISPARRLELSEGSRRELDTYAYVDASGAFILCWDHGRFVNHSCDPAMMPVGQYHEIAVRDIAAGDELTCDYGTLNLVEQLRCVCGSAICRGGITELDLVESPLVERIDALTGSALAVAGAVAQPLARYMLHPDGFALLAGGDAPAPSVLVCQQAR